MSANATNETTATNSTIYASYKGESKVDAKFVAPLVAAVGLILIILGIITVQAVRGFRNKRRRVYHVSDKVLKKGIIAKKVMVSQTTIQNDFAENEPVQTLRYQRSTEHLISDDIDYTTFTTHPSIVQHDDASELPGATQPLDTTDERDSSQFRASANNQAVDNQETSEESFIPRANPLLLHLKKSNKMASLMENSSLTSSMTSGSTTEITDEELILIGTAIKSCPNFGRESSTEYDRDQDEPCETLSYPALTQSTEITQAKTSSSFQLQAVSSASEISSAADNFYQFSAESMQDYPSNESAAVHRKDLWALQDRQDVISDDVIVIEN